MMGYGLRGQRESKQHTPVNEVWLPLARGALLAACLASGALLCAADLALFPWPAFAAYLALLTVWVYRWPRVTPLRAGVVLAVCAVLALLKSPPLSYQGGWLLWERVPVIQCPALLRLVVLLLSLCLRPVLLLVAFYFFRQLLNENESAPVGQIEAGRSMLYVLDQVREFAGWFADAEAPEVTDTPALETWRVHSVAEVSVGKPQEQLFTWRVSPAAWTSACAIILRDAAVVTTHLEGKNAGRPFSHNGSAREMSAPEFVAQCITAGFCEAVEGNAPKPLTPTGRAFFERVAASVGLSVSPPGVPPEEDGGGAG